MVRIKKCMFFLAQNLGFWPKNPIFCHKTPILVNSPFVALRVTVHFPPWERFSDFPFPIYSRFRKKKQLMRQKVFPLPTVRAPSASNSPSALRAQALRGLDKLLIIGQPFPQQGLINQIGKLTPAQAMESVR